MQIELSNIIFSSQNVTNTSKSKASLTYLVSLYSESIINSYNHSGYDLAFNDSEMIEKQHGFCE